MAKKLIKIGGKLLVTNKLIGIEQITTYVDSLNGDDETGKRGNESYPFKTINAALDVSFQHDSIYVKEGEYTEERILRPNLNYYFEDGSVVDTPDTERLWVLPDDYDNIPNHWYVNVDGDGIFKADYRVIDLGGDFSYDFDMKCKEMVLRDNTIYSAIVFGAGNLSRKTNINLVVDGDIDANHAGIIVHTSLINADVYVKSENIQLRTPSNGAAIIVDLRAESTNTTIISDFKWLNEFVSTSGAFGLGAPLDSVFNLYGDFIDTRTDNFGLRLTQGVLNYTGNFESRIIKSGANVVNLTVNGNVVSHSDSTFSVWGLSNIYEIIRSTTNDDITINGNIEGPNKDSVTLYNDSKFRINGNITNTSEYETGEEQGYGIKIHSGDVELILENTIITSPNDGIYSSEPITIYTIGNVDIGEYDEEMITLVPYEE